LAFAGGVEVTRRNDKQDERPEYIEDGVIPLYPGTEAKEKASDTHNTQKSAKDYQTSSLCYDHQGPLGSNAGRAESSTVQLHSDEIPQQDHAKKEKH
jgi:hypothetical protein